MLLDKKDAQIIKGANNIIFSRKANLKIQKEGIQNLYTLFLWLNIFRIDRLISFLFNLSMLQRQL